MNRRLAAEHHDGPSAVAQSAFGAFGPFRRIKTAAGLRIPACRAGDAKVTAQIASAQRNRKRRNEFQFVRNLNLRGEKSWPGSGMAEAMFALETIDAAIMGAEAALRQHRLRAAGAFARERRTRLRHAGFSFWRDTTHN